MTEYNGSYIYYYYLVNYSDLIVYEEDSQYEVFITNIHNYTAVFGIVLSITSLVLNTLIVAVCLRNKTFRCDIFHLQVANFSIANALIGGFVIPLTVYSILYPWNLGNLLCKVWILSDVILPFVSLVILILLNLDRLMLLTHEDSYSCLFQQCLKPILLTGPWIIAFMLVVPLWTHGSLPYELRPGECIVMLSKSVALAGCIITYYAPCLCLVSVALAIILVRLGHQGVLFSCNCHKHSLPNSVTSSEIVIINPPETPITSTKKIRKVSSESVLSVFLASFLFCSMWFPYQCMNLLISFCTSHLCMPSPVLSQVVTWASTASALVVPLAWLVDKNERRTWANLFCGKREQNSSEQDDPV